MTTPKRTDPLTISEVDDAASIFFELFEVVWRYAPEGTSVEDNLKLCETIFSYAHSRRAKESTGIGPFGFNKKPEVTE